MRADQRENRGKDPVSAFPQRHSPPPEDLVVLTGRVDQRTPANCQDAAHDMGRDWESICGSLPGTFAPGPTLERCGSVCRFMIGSRHGKD